MIQLSYPTITGSTSEEQLIQLKDFLYQLIEQLEFAFGEDNGGNEGGASIGQMEDINRALAEMKSYVENAVRNTSLSARKAVNEAIQEVNEIIKGMTIEFTVDIDTGYLNYKIVWERRK